MSTNGITIVFDKVQLELIEFIIFPSSLPRFKFFPLSFYSSLDFSIPSLLNTLARLLHGHGHSHAYIHVDGIYSLLLCDFTLTCHEYYGLNEKLISLLTDEIFINHDLLTALCVTSI